MTLIENNEIFQTITPFITLVVGAWAGNKYAIGKDRRLEFLVVAKPIHETLNIQLLATDTLDLFNFAVKERDLLKLRSYYMYRTWYDRLKGIGYDKAVERYLELGVVDRKRDEYGNFLEPEITTTQINNYKNSIKKLLKYASIK